MKFLLKHILAFLSVGLLLFGVNACTKSDTENGGGGSKNILTDIEGVSSAPRALGSEAVFKAKGARITDIIIITGTGGQRYECEITSAVEGASSFKFRMPTDPAMTTGEYEFSIQRDEQIQNIGKYRLQIKSFIPNVPDDGKSSLRGMVYCDEKGVEGVLVTDGVNIVKTDKNGYYHLESDKRYGLVYVILPSGYDVATSNALPQFWASTNASKDSREQHHFELFKNDNTNHKVIIATDIHIANRNLYPLDLTQFTDGFVKEINETYRGQSNVYCLNLGDFAWDIYWYRYWGNVDTAETHALENATARISGLPCQFWSTMGNHDNDGHAGWATKGNYTYGSDEYWAKDLEASAPFRRVLGPTHVAMNIGNVHYMLLDDINYENTYSATSKDDAKGDDKMGDRDYHGGFRPDVVEWVKQDLSYVDKSTPIVVGFHIPIVNGTGAVLNPEFATNYSQLRAFISLFNDYAEVEFVSGHTHLNRMRPVPGYGTNMYEHNIGSVCGIWWNTSRGSGAGVNAEKGPSGSLCLCSDGTPSGYMTYNVTGKKRSWRYKAIGFNNTKVAETKQFKTYDMNEVQAYFNTYASNFINKITTEGVENTSTSGTNRIKAEKRQYGLEETANTVWINVWGYEKGDFGGYGRCKVEVTENGKTTDITDTVNDNGFRDPLSAVTYDVYRFIKDAKFSSSSMTRLGYNHIFRYVAKSANSTLTIVYTDRFGNRYTETMTRPKRFANNGTPIYTLD